MCCFLNQALLSIFRESWSKPKNIICLGRPLEATSCYRLLPLWMKKTETNSHSLWVESLRISQTIYKLFFLLDSMCRPISNLAYDSNGYL